MYLFYNSRIHVITLYSGHVCVYYALMLRCWHLVWILVRTDHPCLGVGCHNTPPRYDPCVLSHHHSHINVSTISNIRWLVPKLCIAGGDRSYKHIWTYPECVPHDSLSIFISCIWCTCVVTPACHGCSTTSTPHHNSRVVQPKKVTQDGVNLPMVNSHVKIGV
jgi:hypothetical protein